MRIKKKKIMIVIFLIIALSLIVPKRSMAFLWFGDDPIYREPKIITREDKSGLDDMIEDAEAFEKEEGAEVGGARITNHKNTTR